VERFVSDLTAGLKKIEPRVTDGSIMRIYRDIRFSKDKSPYKTGVSAHVRVGKAKDDATPAYYLHIQPKHSLIGAGTWRPASPALAKIRDAIVADPKRWRRATSAGELGGESLQRPPRGYDPNHPLIDDIKRKDFTLGRELADDEVLDANFLQSTLAAYRQMTPVIDILADAIGRAR